MINERKLTERELESRESVLKGLLSNKRNLVKKYGKDAEKVMYGIATKKAKSKVEGMNKDKIKELIQLSLEGIDSSPRSKTDDINIDKSYSGGADYGSETSANTAEDDMEVDELKESKGAKNYFDDLKFNYQKAFRYLDADEKEEYKQLAKNYFSKLQESLNEETFEDEVERLEKTMYVDRRDGDRIFIHPLDKPDVRRPDKSYIAIDGNNVTSVQGYDSGPIADFAVEYNMSYKDSSFDMGIEVASGKASLLSSNVLRDAIEAIKDARDIESKRQSDYYKDRGPVSGVGNMDEMIKRIVKEKLTKKSSVEDHIDDFKDSDAKQFKGKSLDKIKKMALASFLSKQKK